MKTNCLNIHKHKTIASCQYCNLDECCLMAGLEPDELQQISALAKCTYSLKRDEYLYHTGEVSNAVYIIKSGAIKSCLTNKAGESEIIGFYLPGELIGFESLHKGKHLISAICLKKTEVCEVELESLLLMAAKLPKLQRKIFNLMSQRLIAHIDADLKRTAQQNVATFLLDLSQRISNSEQGALKFELQMSRQEIANYLKLTVETISRVLTHLQAQGVIAVQNKLITIVDIEQLRRISIGGF